MTVVRVVRPCCDLDCFLLNYCFRSTLDSCSQPQLADSRIDFLLVAAQLMVVTDRGALARSSVLRRVDNQVCLHCDFE